MNVARKLVSVNNLVEMNKRFLANKPLNETEVVSLIDHYNNTYDNLQALGPFFDIVRREVEESIQILQSTRTEFSL